jgi:hypothetical protein
MSLEMARDWNLGDRLTAPTPVAQGAETEERPGTGYERQENDGGAAKQEYPDEKSRGFFGRDLSGVADDGGCGGTHPGSGHEGACEDIVFKPVCNLTGRGIWVIQLKRHSNDDESDGEPAGGTYALIAQHVVFVLHGLIAATKYWLQISKSRQIMMDLLDICRPCGLRKALNSRPIF